MSIGISALNDIGQNYYYQINKDEVLVYEEDSLRSDKRSDSQKTQDQDKKLQEKKKIEDSASNSGKELSTDEEQLVIDLQSRDAEVHTHEAAHQTGGGGASSYTYQQGPDGKMYAIGGEVSIELRTGSTPDETIANAQQVISAALAPANPSGQDMAVASSARNMMMKAQQQKAKEITEQMQGQLTYKNEADKDNSEDINIIKEIDISA